MSAFRRMANTQSKSYRLPISLLERIEQMAQETEQTQTEVIVALLSRGIRAIDEGETNVLRSPVSTRELEDFPTENWEEKLMPRLQEIVSQMVQDALQNKLRNLGECKA